MAFHTVQFRNHTLKFRFPVDRVETLCPYDAPVILKHGKGEDQKFTRSPYWLQCPHLIRRIHKIESRGWIKTLQDFISGPYKTRWTDFTKRVPVYLKESLAQDYYEVLIQEGRANIGGVEDSSFIKCLHAHYSFFLVHQDGFVGNFVHGLLSLENQRGAQARYPNYCEESHLECEVGRTIQ